MLKLFAALLLVPTPAAASPPPDGQPTVPEYQQRIVPPKKPIPVEPGQRRSDETLSDKLDRSHGVLRPEETPDSGVRMPPVRQGNERDIVVPPTERSPTVEPK